MKPKRACWPGWPDGRGAGRRGNRKWPVCGSILREVPVVRCSNSCAPPPAYGRPDSPEDFPRPRNAANLPPNYVNAPSTAQTIIQQNVLIVLTKNSDIAATR